MRASLRAYRRRLKGKPWPSAYPLRELRWWRAKRRYYRAHPEVLRRVRWAHRHTKKYPDHQVWRDCNPDPRGGTECFTCNARPRLP